MPSYEYGLRLAEHYAGRGDANKQTQGIFPGVTSADDVDVGRVIRDRSGRLTGTAAQQKGSISVHGTRPEGSFTVDAVPDMLPMILMAFFHSVDYTVVSAGATDTGGNYTTPYTETGRFRYGMIDSRPDHEGAVVGVYDPGAADYQSLVAVSDLYSIAVESKWGHGSLGDTDNGQSLDNFVLNSLEFSVQRGPDQVLELTASGFARDGDELADFAEASWGPGLNGIASEKSVFAPDTFSLQVLDVNGVDVISTWDDWLDGITITMTNGMAGRDPLGSSGYSSLSTDGRPSVMVTIDVEHIDPGFISAAKNNQDVVLTVRFSNGANEYMDIVLPLLQIAEGFKPSVGDPGSDLPASISLKGLIDPDVASPLVEVDLTTEFDVRTLSFFQSATLAEASTYTA